MPARVPHGAASRRSCRRPFITGHPLFAVAKTTRTTLSNSAEIENKEGQHELCRSRQVRPPPAQAAVSRTSILPVTAADMRAVRSSFSRSIASWILAKSASIFAISLSR